MRLRPLALRPRRRRPLRTAAVLPSIVTLGNLIAGVLALAFLQDAALQGEAAARDPLLSRAAWMIFLGMFCDALDGRIARLTGSTSAFGAQLDSIADVVTFGVVPAMLAKALLTAAFASVHPRLLLALVVVYAVGAALRLARYNVESARGAADGTAHVTMVFRGLPSPAAAGVVASLVLLRHEYQLWSLDWAVLLSAPLLGLLMVSRFPYPHLLNRWLEGTRPIPVLVLLGVVLFLFIVFFLETIAAMFFLYAASGIALHVLARLTGRPRWVLEEGDDEELEIPPAGDDEDRSAPDAPGRGAVAR